VSFEIRACKSSRQSSFRRKVAKPLLPEPLDRRDPLFRRGLREVFAIEIVAVPPCGDAENSLNGHHCGLPQAGEAVHDLAADAGGAVVHGGLQEARAGADVGAADQE